MTLSMTGFGKATSENENYTISIELKSLNSKVTDINVRVPKIFSELELDLRNIITNKLIRGKISAFIEIERKTNISPKTAINSFLLKEYYTMLTKAAEEVGIKDENVFKLAISMPEVLKNPSAEQYGEEDNALLFSTLNKAIEELTNFRRKEGKTLQTAIESYVAGIQKNLEHIKSVEPQRIEQIKNRIKDSLESLKLEIDQNRFEQELIFYIEKLDITEETVRLQSHINYFLEELKKEDSGKKLGFISQEMGREINTIGSKANNSDIQQIVVQMKDDLEKIKEQLLNIL